MRAGVWPEIDRGCGGQAGCDAPPKGEEATFFVCVPRCCLDGRSDFRVSVAFEHAFGRRSLKWFLLCRLWLAGWLARLAGGLLGGLLGGLAAACH